MAFPEFVQKVLEITLSGSLVTFQTDQLPGLFFLVHSFTILGSFSDELGQMAL